MSDIPTPSSNGHITFTLPDKTTASRLVDLVVRTKPHGWGRKSYSTYYKKQYGEWLASELNILLDTRKERVFRLTGRYTMTTLYLLASQAFLWLREETEGEDKKKWNALWEDVQISKMKGVGVIIKFKELPADMPTGEEFVPKQELPKWKMELDEWLNGDDIKPFHKDRLVLSNEQVENITNELDGLGNIMFSVTNKEIKVIKTS